MKGKQLFLLLVLAVLAVGGWYYLTERNRNSWTGNVGGGAKILEFPINDVTRIKIKSAEGELNIVKKGDTWSVQERADYPANFEQVSDFLRKLWELKTVQEVKVGAKQVSRLDLDEPGKGEASGTVVELIGADDKALTKLQLGKKFSRKSEGGGGDLGIPGFAIGRYVKPIGGTKVSLVSNSFDDAEPKPEKWLAKDFIKIEGPKSISVDGPSDGQKWTVTRESASGEWKLADAKPDEKVDSNKTFSLGSIFSSPTFDDVLAPDAKPETTGLDKPTMAKIETFDGFTYELKIGKSNGKSTPVTVNVTANLPKERTPGKDEKPEDKTKLDDEFKAKQKKLEEKLASEQKFAGRVYLVTQFSVEPLLKDRAALLPDKPAAPAPGSPESAPAPGAPPMPIRGIPAPVPGVPPAPAPGASPAPAPDAPATPAPGAPPAPAPDAPPVPAPGVPPAPAPGIPPAPAPGIPPAPAPGIPPAPAPGAAPAPAPDVPPAPAPSAPSTPPAAPVPAPGVPPTPAPGAAPAPAPAPAPAAPPAAPPPDAAPAPNPPPAAAPTEGSKPATDPSAKP